MRLIELIFLLCQIFDHRKRIRYVNASFFVDCSSCDIRYSEGIQSLNWAKIMKTITDDPEGFFDSGGWTFLDPESEGEAEANSETEDEEDDAYEPTDDDDEEESDSEDYSEASEDDDSGSEEGI